MKITNSLTVAVLLCFAVSSKADYAVTFNTANDQLSNPVFDVDGTTRLGTSFLGQIYAGTSLGSLSAIGSAVQFGTVGGSANAGANGFIINNIVTATSAITPGTTVVYQLRAWTGAATYELASVTGGAKIGVSSPLTGNNIVVQGSPSLTTPPNTSLHGSFTLSTVAAIPEPATLALGLFGAAGFFIRRRK